MSPYVIKSPGITKKASSIALSAVDLCLKYKDVEKLSDEDKDHVIRCYGEFQSLEVIKDQLDPRSPLYHNQMIEMLCSAPENRLKVMNYRNKYLTRLKDVAISHKRVRIDDLEVLRQRFTHQISLLDDTLPEDRKEFRFMATGLVQILSQAHDEVEGKGINIHLGLGVFGMEDMDGKSDDELISRREELLKKASRAIGINLNDPRVGIADSSGRGALGDNGDTAHVIEAKAEQSS